MILLLHDGELRDLHGILAELGIRVRERVGPLRPAEAKAAWKTVFATPRRLLDFKALPSGPRPTLVAIADQCSNTLRTQMQRLRVDYIVNRPVHPVAMRLLLLHAVYNGPERRRLDRITIGAPVRIKLGLFAKPATLAEISRTGARLMSPQPLAPDSKLRIVIGRELTKSSVMRLGATVVRAIDAGDEGTEVGVQFDALKGKQAETLKRFIDLHRRGPVQIRHHVADSSPPIMPRAEAARKVAAPRPLPPVAPKSRPDPSATTDAATAIPTSSQAPEAGAGASERRHDGRHAYASRVVALGDEAARVFIGRDISTGGMRVDTHPDLGLGARLKLALHAGPRSEPVLVSAVVDRDDGDGGVFLRFCEIGNGRQRELDQMIGRLAFSTGDPDDGDIVISELIEFEAGQPPA